MLGLGKLLGYGLRAIKAVPKLIFGTGSEAVGNAMRAAVKGTKGGSIFTAAKAAGKAGLKTLESGVTGKAFIKAVGKDIVGLPKFLASGAKAGFTAAKAAGKSGILGGIKGLFGSVAKKMPLIGTLLMVGCEVPNIWRAATDKEGGLGTALVEAGKATARLAGGAAGAAIGSAICPGIGSLIGWVAGEWLTGKVVGKTFTEKKEEQQQLAQQQEAINQFRQMGLSDEEIQYCLENGITVEALQQQLQQQQPQQTAVTNPATQQPTTNGYYPTTGYPAYPSTPGMTDPFSLSYNNPLNANGNSYTNDIFYQQLFGPSTNPYQMEQTTYTNPYMPMYPQQYMQYSA